MKLWLLSSDSRCVEKLRLKSADEPSPAGFQTVAVASSAIAVNAPA